MSISDLNSSESDWLPERRCDDTEERLEYSESSLSDTGRNEFLRGIDEEALLGVGASLGRRRKRNRKQFGKRVTRRKKGTAEAPTVASPEVEQMLRAANDSYINGDIWGAVAQLEEVVRISPGLHDPFHTLGLIYEEELKDKKKAVTFYLIAAHIIPKDANLWLRIASMSQELGNITQTTYALRRALSANYAESVAYDLASCYFDQGDFKRASRHLQRVHDDNPSDIDLATQLALCYNKQQRYGEAFAVLARVMPEDLNSQEAENIGNMAAEMLLADKKFSDCTTLLERIIETHEASLTDVSIDLRVKLACCYANLQQVDHPRVETAKTRLRAMSPEEKSECADLFVAFASSLCTAGETKAALELFLVVWDMPFVRKDIAIWTQMANCYVNEDKISEAAVHLSHAIDQNLAGLTESEFGIADAAPRMLLARIFQRLNRHSDADEIILSVPFKGLREAETLPDPMPTTKRQDFVTQLRKDINELENDEEKLGDGQSSMAEEEWKRDMENIHKRRADWCDRFTHIVRDCELDLLRLTRRMTEKRLEATQRVSTEGQESGEAADDDEGLLALATPKKSESVFRWFTKKSLKQDAGLWALDDILGPVEFNNFLARGLETMRRANRHKEAVNLAQVIIANKKGEKAADVNFFNKSLREKLRMIALHISLDGDMRRTSVAILRDQWGSKSKSSARRLEAIGRLLFRGRYADNSLYPLSTTPERESLLENRSWTIRQLVQRPKHPILTLLVGHYCILSARWASACAEYIRAHQLLPKEPWIVLSIATAYLSYATSRNVPRRHAAVVRGFIFLAAYKKMVLKELGGDEAEEAEEEEVVQIISSSDPKSNKWRGRLKKAKVAEAEAAVRSAEMDYNFGRGFHQFNLLNLALQSYFSAFEFIEKAKGILATATPTDEPLGPRGNFTKLDVFQLEVCLLHNISLCQSSGDDEAARRMYSRRITWEG